MRLENDQVYYQRRATQQLAIARAAVDPGIRAIHMELASRYARLSELAEQHDPEKEFRMRTPMQVATGR